MHLIGDLIADHDLVDAAHAVARWLEPCAAICAQTPAMWLGSTTRVLGRLHAITGAKADAARELRWAIAHHQRLGAVTWAARSRDDLESLRALTS